MDELDHEFRSVRNGRGNVSPLGMIPSAKEPGEKWWHGRLARAFFPRKRGRDAHAT